jgi:hypothetical protein
MSLSRRDRANTSRASRRRGGFGHPCSPPSSGLAIRLDERLEVLALPSNEMVQLDPRDEASFSPPIQCLLAARQETRRLPGCQQLSGHRAHHLLRPVHDRHIGRSGTLTRSSCDGPADQGKRIKEMIHISATRPRGWGGGPRRGPCLGGRDHYILWPSARTLAGEETLMGARGSFATRYSGLNEGIEICGIVTTAPHSVWGRDHPCSPASLSSTYGHDPFDSKDRADSRSARSDVAPAPPPQTTGGIGVRGP